MDTVSTPTHGLAARVAVAAAATGCGVYIIARLLRKQPSAAARQDDELLQLQAALEHEQEKRKAERVGRTRAEQELRALRVQLQQLQLAAAAGGGAAAAAAAPSGAAGARGGSAVLSHALSSGTSMAADDDNAAGALADAIAAVVAGSAEGNAAAAAAAVPLTAAAANVPAVAVAALAAASAMPVFPLRPIGHIHSVFTERNGTPRQPQLVPLARARLVLCPNVPPACLEGLTQYSHCWILYVFHANTDLAKYLSAERAGLKAKIHVPRLNGGRMGVLATRSPHRPSPIGLSTAQVIAVQNNTLIIGGADIVDGSPVLDIKPYVPFCDSLPYATAPAWVKAEADDEPLAIAQVVVGPAAEAALVRAWSARRAHSLYPDSASFLDLVKQVLSRDIRSVHQRINVGPSAPAAAAPTAAATAAAAGVVANGASGDRASARPAQPSAPSSSSAAQGVGPAVGASAANGTAKGAAVAASNAAGGVDAGQQLLAGARESGGGGGWAGGSAAGHYHVVLENVYISYDVSEAGEVVVRDARVDAVTAEAQAAGR